MFCVISQNHAINGLCYFLDESPSRVCCPQPSLVTIDIMVVEIIFLELEEQDSTCSLYFAILFVPEKHFSSERDKFSDCFSH